MVLRKPFTLLLHIALAAIAAGAIITHFAGVQGRLSLRQGEPPVHRIEVTSGPGDGELPFGVALAEVEISYYPGTSAPMDFKSVLDVDGEKVAVSMNRVGEVNGWRFYQTAVAPGSSTLSVSHDQWGIAITYCGYAMLLIGMAGFFFQRRSAWRALLRGRRAVLVAMLAIQAATAVAAAPPAMQKPLAAKMSTVYVYWNDRVCPMQTMACDVATTLYGSAHYKGLTPEQVLSGWLFYFDEWYRDYVAEHPEVASLPEIPSSKKEKKLLEKIGLIQWLGTGEAFRIYPYHTGNGATEWLSLTGRKPSAMPLEQWEFMQSTMPHIKAHLLAGRNVKAGEELESLKLGQRRYAGASVLPSEAKMTAERFFNRLARPALAGIVALALAAMFLLLPNARRLYRAASAAAVALFLYLLGLMGALWWIGAHVPLSNGPETMLFMGLVAVGGALMARRSATLRGCLCAVAGLALMVAAMAGKTPRIGVLMPVLASPLLSLHVMIVMTSYVLFMLMALISAVALCSRSRARKEALSVTNRIILVPAVCLLGVGIFIGAVWANQSWGHYWGWDPKETCALVTWFVYAIPAHWHCRALRCFRRPRVLHIYLLLSILCVLFTYFGANYLLPGLHSYA